MELTKWRMAGYGAGNLASAVPFQFITGFFYFYATSVLRLHPGLVGLVVGLSVVWDAVADPVMGYVSDHSTFKALGRRHFYLIAGAIGMALSNYLLWTIQPESARLLKLFLAAAYLFLCKTFLAVYTTPYNALAAELTADYNGRTAVQTYKTAFFIIGFLFPSVAGMTLFFKPTPEYPVGQLNPDAYHAMGIFSSVITLAAAAVCIFATVKFIPVLPRASGARASARDLYADMFLALRNKNFRSVVIGYLFINITASLLSAVGLHAMTYTYRLNNYQMALVFGGLFAVAVVTQPLWMRISARRGKKTAVMLAISLGLIGSAIFLPTVFLRHWPGLNMALLLAAAAVLGASTGGCLSLPYSMLADTIDEDELMTGRRREGVYYGTLMFMYKLSQAIIVFVLGIVLSTIGFDAGLKEQLPSVAVSIGLILPVGSLIAFMLARVFFGGYDLNQKKLEEIQRQIHMQYGDRQ